MTHKDLKVSDDTTPRLVLATGHSAAAVDAVFLSDDKMIASVGYDRSLILWDVDSGEMLRKIQFADPDSSWNDFSPDGQYIIGFDGKEVGVWNVLTGIQELVLAEEYIEAVVAPGGKFLAVYCGNRDKTSILLLDYPSQRIIRRMEYPSNAGLRGECFFSRDAAKLVVFPYDDEEAILVFDTATGFGVPLQRGEEVSFGESWPLYFTPLRLDTGEYIRTDKEAAFLPDGSGVAVAFTSGDVALLDAAMETVKYRVKVHYDWARSVALSSCGRRLVTAGDDRVVRILDAETGKVLKSFGNRIGAVNSIAFSKDGHTLISGNDDGTLRFWDMKKFALGSTIKAASSPVTQVAIAGERNWVAGLSADNRYCPTDARLMVWDIEDGGLIESLSAYGYRYSFGFSSNGLLLYPSAKGTFTLRDVSTGQIKHTFFGYSPVAISHDERIYATGDAYGNDLGLRNIDTGEVVQTIVTRVGASAKTDRRKMVDEDYSGYPGPAVSAVFSRDGRILATGDWSYSASLWNTDTGELRGRCHVRIESVCAIDFSPDGKTLATGTYYDHVVQLFSTHTMKEKRMLTEHTDTIRSLAFSPDGRTLATASKDGTIRLWNPRNGKLLVTLVVFPSSAEDDVSNEWLAFTPDGYYTGSEHAEAFMRWDENGTLVPGERYRDMFRRADLLKDIK